MSTRYLDKLFHPKRIAIIGASDQPGSVGSALVENLKDQFDGALDLVHPRHREIMGLPVTGRIEDLQCAPDLAIIATPPRTVPEIVSLLGARGTGAAIVVAAGFDSADPQLFTDLERAAFAHDIRIVGPSSVGIIVPSHGMNASFAVGTPPHGKLALVSQSGAIMGAVIDWALQERIGFSSLISLGQKSDVDFADVVDYLSADIHTRAILLCIEETANARKLMSALRAGARSRPIVALKIGRSHRPGLNQLDVQQSRAQSAVFSAALRRAGVLQVNDLDQLFGAAEILGRVRSVPGDRLAVMTNGGGVGVLAAERFTELGGRMAHLSNETMTALRELLPPAAVRGNPVDMLGDADSERYRHVAELLLADVRVDGLAVIHCPTKLADSGAIAQALAGPVRTAAHKGWPPKPLLTVWLGESRHSPQRMELEDAGIPTFRTPAAAVQAFAHLLHHDRAQSELMQTPPAMRDEASTDLAAAKGLVAARLAEGGNALSLDDTRSLLSAFGFDVADNTDRDQLVTIGVGFVDDPVFGPALYIGLRTSSTDRGRATLEGMEYALPPLNPLLAVDLVRRSGLAQDEAVRDAIGGILVRLAQLSHDLRDVRQLDADIVLEPERGVRLAPRSVHLGEEKRIDRHGVNPRFAIRPYPAQWESRIRLKDGRPVDLRPIRPEDEALYDDFLAAVDRNDLRLRFFTPTPNLNHDFLARLTQIDYARSMAFIALDTETGALLGVVRLHVEPNHERGEYAVLVRSGLKGLGLGWHLMQQIIAYGRYEGVGEIYGEVLKENVTMLAMCEALGFASIADAEDRSLMHVTLDLTHPPE